MMFRAISATLVVGLLCSGAVADETYSNVIRPKKVNARVNGCQVSAPGSYSAFVGDLIELEYTFPVVPAAIPKVVEQTTDKGAVYTSTLGIRNLVVPNMVGTSTYLFYFEAKFEGRGTAFVVIDDVEYEYRFNVENSPIIEPVGGLGRVNASQPPLKAKLDVDVGSNLEIGCQFRLSHNNDQAFQNSEYRYSVLDSDGIQVNGALIIRPVIRAILLPKDARSVQDTTDANFNKKKLKRGQKYYLVISVRNLTGLAEFVAP